MTGLPATDGWKEAPLGDVAVIDRSTIFPEEIESGTKYVGLEDLDSEGRILAVNTVRNGDLASSKFTFGPQHILYGKLRPYLRKIARPDFAGICSTDILPIRPTRVDRGFLFHYLRQPHLVEHATRRCEGANLPRLSPADLERFPVHFPSSSEEQQRIAVTLDKADAIRQKRRAAIDHIDDLIQVAFLDLVGPGAREYKSWPVVTIESLARAELGCMRTGPFGSDLRHSEFVDSGIAVLGIDNVVKNRFAWGELRFITQQKYTELVRFTVRPNDVLITIMGTTGRSVVVPEDIPTAITTKHLACITLNQELADPEFVSNAVHRHPAVLAQIGLSHRGAIMPGLNLTLVKGLKLHLPPIDRQREFARFIKRARSLDDRLQDAAAVASEMFHALVQRAFAGGL